MKRVNAFGAYAALMVSDRQIGTLWCAVALPFLLLLVFLTPPIQSPDEQNHFLRVVQVGEGHFVGARLNPYDSGGEVPTAAFRFAHAFDDIPFHMERKVSLARLREINRIAWTPERMKAGFPNTVLYPPAFYLAAAVGVDVGRILDLSVEESFYLARIADVLICAAIGTLALVLAPGALRLALAFILSMPMTLGLCASCSQDGMLIVSSALCVALMGRWRLRSGFSPLASTGVGLMLGCIVASKLPYAPLLILPAILGSTAKWRSVVLAIVPGVLIAALWLHVGVRAAGVPFLHGTGVDAGQQVHFIVSHPRAACHAVIRTYELFARNFIQQFFGVLGWVDAFLPNWSYRVMECLFAGVLAYCLFHRAREDRLRGVMQAGAILAVVAVSVWAVSLALYVAWTVVGYDHIDGIQGRYFIPLALFASLALPAGPPPGSAPGWRMAASLGLTGVTLGVAIGASVTALSARYW